MRVWFSSAAATRSLSASCLLTSSAVLCEPSLSRTSTLNRGGKACSSLTRTPSPITVARLQWVMVGVSRTVTLRRGDDGERGSAGVMLMSCSETTASSASGIGCSGSDIVAIRSVPCQLPIHGT